jgi:hypothetical protein
MNWLWVDHGGMDWSEYTHAYCYERRKTAKATDAPQLDIHITTVL